MKIIHTSDWHLGRSLYGRKRYQEGSAFLDWLAQLILDEGIDILLVAGDVFDTSMPSNRAQELYYRFLCRVSRSRCRGVVIIAGNHDSPSFLNAPRELLQTLKVSVVGSITGNPEDQVIPILDFSDGALNPRNSAIICAVPYLRDKDIRTAEPGETVEDKNRKLVAGITAHYAAVFEHASHLRSRLLQDQTVEDRSPHLPIIAMGHLFTTGGTTIDGDGVRELYVGTLAHVGSEVFPAGIDYLALGHLHVPQQVGRTPHFRYSGSPLPIGFGEATQQKYVVLIDYGQSRHVPVGDGAADAAVKPEIRLLPVPRFQELVRISGPLEHILVAIQELKTQDSRAWLEVEYTGSELLHNLRETLEEALTGSALEILRIKNRRVLEQVAFARAENENLDDLEPGEVFARCLEAHEIPEPERTELTSAYNEIVTSLIEEDRNEH